MQLVQLLIPTLVLGWSTSAMAYVGPGLGLGTVGAVLAFVFSILLAMIALFWYPLKRIFGIGRSGNQKQNGDVKSDPDE